MMKNFRFLRGRFTKNQIYRGSAKNGWLRQFADLRGDLVKKMKRGFFWGGGGGGGGGLIPNAHY